MKSRKKAIRTRVYLGLVLALSLCANAVQAGVPAKFWVGQEPEQEWAGEALMPEGSGYLNRPVEECLKIEDNIYTFRRGNHRTMFVVTDAGVIVMDPMKPAIADRMYEVIRKITDKPIKYMIYSHNHWDHTRGGKVFKDAGAVVIAHELAARALKDWPNEEVVPPDLAWSGDTYEISLGDIELELHYFGENHGEGLTFFYFPQTKLVHIIDVVSPNRLPPGVPADFKPKGIVDSLTKSLELDFERVVPAHTPYDVAPRTTVSEMAEYWTILRGIAKETFAKTGDDLPPWFIVPRMGVVEKYKHWDYFQQFHMGNAARCVFELYLGY
jgi:glyoxylase-like metal-dependent hydrolase (beta-lactamase superfamily II)